MFRAACPSVDVELSLADGQLARAGGIRPDRRQLRGPSRFDSDPLAGGLGRPSAAQGLSPAARLPRHRQEGRKCRLIKLSIVGGFGALVLALGSTALTVRSITYPLRRMEQSMASITRGELDFPLPPAGVREIGAMTRTLGIFATA